MFTIFFIFKNNNKLAYQNKNKKHLLQQKK